MLRARQAESVAAFVQRDSAAQMQGFVLAAQAWG
jgi:hypothetical protein